MTSRTLVFGGLLAAVAAGAAEPPLMTLRLESPAAAEGWRPALQALGRYPGCFDAVALAGPADGPAAEALAAWGVARLDAAARPAGVALETADDHAPRALVGAALLFAARAGEGVAALGCGRQCASGKSAHGLCVEATLALAYGASALEFDLLRYPHETAAWVANTYLSELTLWRPFWQAYARFNAGTRPGGLLPFCGRQARAAPAGTLEAAAALAPAGLPVCPGSPWPVAYLVNAASVASMGAVDVQRVLSGGAVLDGGAAAALQARGFGAALQVGAAPRQPEADEVFTDDELNLDQVGYAWRPAARAQQAFALFPSNEAVRVIGRYRADDGGSAEAASTLYETPQGGRLAVFGFDGFGPELSSARRLQLLRAADWAAQNRLPVFVETAAQAVAVPRVTLAGELRSVLLLNASIDAQPPVTLRLRGCAAGLARVEWLAPREKPVTVAVRWEGGDALVTVPAIGPWQLGWLRAAE